MILYTVHKDTIIDSEKDLEGVENRLSEIPQTVQKLWEADVKKLRAGPVRICFLCEDEGHGSRDCPKRGESLWCKICGDDLHIEKYCNKSKAECARCGQKDNHHSMLHMTKDKHKRLYLLKEQGENFSHFIYTPIAEKQGSSGTSSSGSSGGDFGSTTRAKNDERSRSDWAKSPLVPRRKTR